MTTSSVDAVVLGSGIAGCATAYELAKRGLSVAILERGTTGGHQSRRALGFISAISSSPTKVRLSALATRHWESVPAELEADLEFTQAGEVVVVRTPAEYRALRRWMDLARALGVPVRTAESEDLTPLGADAAEAGLRGAVNEIGAHAEPSKVVQAFLAAARRLGVTVQECCRVRAITASGGRVTGVRTAEGDISAPVVICATGASTTGLLRVMGIRLPTVIVRGMVLETEPIEPVTRAAVWVSGVAFRQRPSGSLYISDVTQAVHSLTLDSFRFAREFAPGLDREVLKLLRIDRALFEDVVRAGRRRACASGFAADPLWLANPRPARGVSANALHVLRAVWPRLAGVGVQREWAGSIEFTPDDLPVVGPVGGPDGLIVHTGFSGHGITLAPLLADRLARLVVDGRSSEELESLNPLRFATGDYAPPASRPY